MSLNNRSQHSSVNEGDIRFSKSKSNIDDDLTSPQVHEYVIQRSSERAGLSQIKHEEHPIVTAKGKSMNLTSVVGSQDPQVGETKPSLELAVKTNRKFEKPHASIAYHYDTGRSKPKISRPQVPKTWGQETTGPLQRDRTVRSASRDHPYTPYRRDNVARSKKNPNEAIKLQKVMKSTNGVGSTDLHAEVRINPEEEFKKLNEEIANKTYQAEAAAPCAGEAISTQDEEKLTAEMVSLYPSQGNLTQESDFEIPKSVSNDLSVVEPALLVHTYTYEDVSQHHSNTSNGSFFLKVSNEPLLTEITKIIRSLQHMPSYEEEFEPKPGSSKAPDLDVLRKLESFDLSSNPIEMTEPTKPSERSDVKYRSSDAFQEDDAITYELANFSLPYSDGTSSGNSRVVPSARLEELEEILRKSSGQFASSQNVHKVILDETSSSIGQVSMASESVQDVAEELPESIASSSLVGLSIIEPSKISPIGSDSSSIVAFAVSLKGSSLPSFLPVSATPVSQKRTSSSQIESPETVQFSKGDPTKAANRTVEVKTVMGINASKIREGVAHFRNRQRMSSLSALLNSAATSTPFSASKLNLLNNDNIYIFRKEISQPLDILTDAVFLHLLIPITCTSLCILRNEQPKKQFSLGDLLRTVIGQMTGIFGLELSSVIRTFSRLCSSEMAHGKASSEEYGRLIVYIDIILLINPTIKDSLNPVIQTNENYRMIILNLIDTRCKIILPNPAFSDDCQISSYQFFEQGVPLSKTIWTKATQLFVPGYDALKNSVLHGFQMDQSLSLLLTIPQFLDTSDLTSNKLPSLVSILKEKLKACVHKTDDILTAVKLHILGIMLPLRLTLRLLNPTNAPTNIVEQQWQLERCDSSALLVHDAVNPILILLLRRR